MLLVHESTIVELGQVWMSARLLDQALAGEPTAIATRVEDLHQLEHPLARRLLARAVPHIIDQILGISAAPAAEFLSRRAVLCRALVGISEFGPEDDPLSRDLLRLAGQAAAQLAGLGVAGTPADALPWLRQRWRLLAGSASDADLADIPRLTSSFLDDGNGAHSGNRQCNG